MKELFDKLLAYFRANGVTATAEYVDEEVLPHSLTHYYYML